MNHKYVYALSKEDKEELIAKGFKIIGEKKLGKQQAYLFEVNLEKSLFFNETDKKKFLFSNIVYI